MLPGGVTADALPRPASVATPLARLAHAGVVILAFWVPISLAGIQIAFLVTLGALLAARLAGVRPRRPTGLALPLLLAGGASLLAVVIARATGHFWPGLEGATRWKPIVAPLVLLPALSLPLAGEDDEAPRRRALAAILAWSVGAALAGIVGIGQGAANVDLLQLVGRRAVANLPEVPRWPGHAAATGFYYGYPQYSHNLVPVLALGAALALGAGLRGWRRALVAAGAALAAAGVAFTVSRGAWASLVAVAIVLVALLGGRARRGAALALGVAIAAALLHPGIRIRVGRAFLPGENLNRVIILRACEAVREEHPLFGVGPGAFNAYAERHFQRIEPNYPKRSGCHLSPADLLVEGGPLLAGAWATAYLLLVIRFLRRGRRGDPLARAAAAGAVAALVGLLVNGLFHDVDRESHAMWAIALVLTLAAALAEPRRRPVAASPA